MNCDARISAAPARKQSKRSAATNRSQRNTACRWDCVDRGRHDSNFPEKAVGKEVAKKLAEKYGPDIAAAIIKKGASSLPGRR